MLAPDCQGRVALSLGKSLRPDILYITYRVHGEHRAPAKFEHFSTSAADYDRRTIQYSEALEFPTKVTRSPAPGGEGGRGLEDLVASPHHKVRSTDQPELAPGITVDPEIQDKTLYSRTALIPLVDQP
ncbi:hypothetical protein E4U54_001222 [Claviceps lovelessii]|nr:hypothetical protein E4U54_001222 [Claviceps lovelessii]